MKDEFEYLKNTKKIAEILDEVYKVRLISGDEIADKLADELFNKLKNEEKTND